MRDGRGEIDALLRTFATGFEADGRHVVGTVQHNIEIADRAKCAMRLEVLPTGQLIDISQDLGDGAIGCRLDPDGFAAAVQAVQNGLERGADLFLVNKFGKQEAEGGGFRNLIGVALSQNIPVICGLNKKNLPAFEQFAEGMAEEVTATLEALTSWFEDQACDAQ
ncbi:DUF2478 domain-containing protein [Celeribacter sp. ASW11-22]|nr:DUF2478 domain-containing protein [Celeribacter litoreus]